MKRMSDETITQEPLSDYERLHFPSFGNSPGKKSAMHRSGNNEEVELPTAAQLEEIQRQAHDEGYQAGLASGLEAGSQQIEALLKAMTQAMQQADQEIAQELLDLSLEVARQMVQQTLKIHPEVLLNTIRAAITSLPHFNQGSHLVLHPDDAELVRASMGEQLTHTGWKVFEDAQIARGGARVETAHSQIDASLENRWQRIVAAIGQDSSWLPQ
jgi:flagellar assembly protein FliH